jgi:Cyclin M transmembrane N-terminal domain
MSTAMIDEWFESLNQTQKARTGMGAVRGTLCHRQILTGNLTDNEMTNILFEVTAIALLIIANGIFSMSEMAIVAARKSRLQDWAERGNTGAKAALKLAENLNQFFSTVQIGITLVGILPVPSAAELWRIQSRPMLTVYRGSALTVMHSL